MYDSFPLVNSCEGLDIVRISSVLIVFSVRDYVRSELDSGYEGPVYLEPLSMNRFTTALIGIILIGIIVQHSYY